MFVRRDIQMLGNEDLRPPVYLLKIWGTFESFRALALSQAKILLIVIQYFA